MNLREIKAPIARHMSAFEEHFSSAMQSKVPLLSTITRYIVKRKGKQMRPLFVFFAADLFSGINPRTYRAATLIEMLHTATLIHDDVVDDSNERRGFFSLNALWKNKISVLMGDFLLSRGLLLALEHDDFDLLKIVSNSVKEMSEGELLQMEKARSLNIDEAVYFEIIRKKTASLIASCLACGTASAGQTPEVIEKMRLIGEYIGIAFQIKDDILDFDLSGMKGKPTAGDIKERKMTLPLIFTINHSDKETRRKIIGIVKNEGSDTKKVEWLIDTIITSGGMEYAAEKMAHYRNLALDALDAMPDMPARQSLRQLIDFTIQRKH